MICKDCGEPEYTNGFQGAFCRCEKDIKTEILGPAGKAEIIHKQIERIKELELALKESRQLYADAKGKIETFKEYLQFLYKANEGPISMAHAHGWRCPKEDIEKGEDFREKLNL